MKNTTTTVWSDEQKAIFNWFGLGTGNLVVQARAGTGKTTTIKEAFSVAPEDQMLYAVFNKKNQVEAAEKITDERVDIKTLHALGFRFIRSMWPGVKPDSYVERDRICNGVDYPYEVVNQVCKLVGFAKNTIAQPSHDDLVQIAQDRGIEVDEILEAPENGGFTVGKLATMALKAIERSAERDDQNRISFDDMVWLPIRMGWVRACYDLVVIDEAQDMNALQLEMATKSAKKNGRTCLVGDDRQAIYGFRGAVSDGLNLMRERLDAATLGLTVTYRCPKSVVAVAQEIVSDYTAHESAPDGVVKDTKFERLTEVVSPGDAVLSRINAPLMGLCLHLLRRGTPARIEGRDIGKTLLGIIKKFRARSVPKFMEKLGTWKNRQIKRLTKAGVKSRLALVEDQFETLVAVAEGASSVREIEKRLTSLFRDTVTGETPCVVLSSVHKAKGLEWDRVFMLRSTFLKRLEREEENIYYVAVTRAKQELYFVEG